MHIPFSLPLFTGVPLPVPGVQSQDIHLSNTRKLSIQGQESKHPSLHHVTTKQSIQGQKSFQRFAWWHSQYTKKGSRMTLTTPTTAELWHPLSRWEHSTCSVRFGNWGGPRLVYYRESCYVMQACPLWNLWSSSPRLLPWELLCDAGFDAGTHMREGRPRAGRFPLVLSEVLQHSQLKGLNKGQGLVIHALPHLLVMQFPAKPSCWREAQCDDYRLAARLWRCQGPHIVLHVTIWWCKCRETSLFPSMHLQDQIVI